MSGARLTIADVTARLKASRLVPVVSIATLEQGRETVDRLVEAGAGVIEIVLRTSIAIEALAEARRRHPSLMVAAGTVLSPQIYDDALAAGAHFAVSPGFEVGLALHSAKGAIPLIPGVQTASEVMTANRHGYAVLKYYPAEPSNGSVVLADYAKVFPGTQFMPTGKLGPTVLAAYGALPNVLCVGGSWMFSSGNELRSVDETAGLLAAGRAAFSSR